MLCFYGFRKWLYSCNHGQNLFFIGYCTIRQSLKCRCWILQNMRNSEFITPMVWEILLGNTGQTFWKHLNNDHSILPKATIFTEIYQLTFVATTCAMDLHEINNTVLFLLLTLSKHCLLEICKNLFWLFRQNCVSSQDII